MTTKWILINILLAAVTCMAGYQLYESVQDFKVENDVANIKPEESQVREEILQATPYFQQYSPLDFADIPEKNVFSETRSREESAETSTVATMPANIRPTLVGILITEKQRVATLRGPSTRRTTSSNTRGTTNQITRGRGGQITRGTSAPSGENQILRIGDTYEGYTVEAIEKDHVALDNGTQQVILELNDLSQPVQTRRMAAVTTQVVPIGGSNAGAGGPAVIIAGQTGTSRGSQIQTALRQLMNAQGNNRNTPQAITAGQPGSTPQTNAQTILNLLQQRTGTPTLPITIGGSQQGTTTFTLPTTVGGSQQGTRVIRTPFGEIRRNN